MGRMTRTVNGSVASFKSPGAVPIRSLKAYFTPIQNGSGDPSPENVRPISGWTGVQVTKTGKNMLNPSTYKDTSPYTSHDVTFVHDGNGTVSVSGTNSASSEVCVGFMWVQPFTCNYYVCSNLGVTSTYADVYIWDLTTSARVKQWDGETASLSSAKNRPIVQVQLPAGHQIRITCRVFPGKNVDGVSFKPMLLATNCTDTTFETYVGEKIPVFWESLGTVYGGYVDPVTGEIWKNYDVLTFDGNEAWARYPERYNLWLEDKTGIAVYGPGAQTFCSHLRYHGTVTDVFGTYRYNPRSGTPARTYLQICDLGDTQFGASLANFIAWVKELYNSGTPLQLAVPLAEPVLVATLSSSQLRTLAGSNSIWSDAGDVEVNYDYAEPNDIIRRKFSMMMQKPIQKVGIFTAGYEARVKPNALNSFVINHNLGIVPRFCLIEMDEVTRISTNAYVEKAMIDFNVVGMDNDKTGASIFRYYYNSAWATCQIQLPSTSASTYIEASTTTINIAGYPYGTSRSQWDTRAYYVVHVWG